MLASILPDAAILLRYITKSKSEIIETLLLADIYWLKLVYFVLMDFGALIFTAFTVTQDLICNTNTSFVTSSLW